MDKLITILEANTFTGCPFLKIVMAMAYMYRKRVHIVVVLQILFVFLNTVLFILQEERGLFRAFISRLVITWDNVTFHHT